jgi:murein L,D-transpeptidase YafK
VFLDVDDLMKIRRIHLFLCAALAVIATVAVSCHRTMSYTVNDRLAQYGPAARERLKPDFAKAQVPYPPGKLVFAGFKQERTFEVYATNPSNQWRLVSTYPILGASGLLGPKLQEGDYQVPEGIYAIELLNPNSTHHVSLRIGYPNDFDRAQAAMEGRTNLGEDIMIHGGRGSIGCLAMGDEVSESLFVLAADTGISNITVVISPVDFRAGRTLPPSTNQPVWVGKLYEDIKAKLAELPRNHP